MTQFTTHDKLRLKKAYSRKQPDFGHRNKKYTSAANVENGKKRQQRIGRQFNFFVLLTNNAQINQSLNNQK